MPEGTCRVAAGEAAEETCEWEGGAVLSGSRVWSIQGSGGGTGSVEGKRATACAGSAMV